MFLFKFFQAAIKTELNQNAQYRQPLKSYPFLICTRYGAQMSAQKRYHTPTHNSNIVLKKVNCTDTLRPSILQNNFLRRNRSHDLWSGRRNLYNCAKKPDVDVRARY